MNNEKDKITQLLYRVKSSHQTIYLTQISIILGFLFGYLLVTVNDSRPLLLYYDWFLIFTTLLILIETWNEYVMGTLTFVWIPDILDAIIPYLLGVSGAFMIYAIDKANDEKLWFLASAIYAFISVWAYVNMYDKSKHYEDNRITFTALGNYVQKSKVYPLIASFIFLILWLILLNYPRSEFLLPVLVVIAVFVVIGFAIFRIVYWRKFLSYLKQVANLKDDTPQK